MINGALPSRPKSAYYAYLPQQIFALMKTSFVCLQKASSRFLHQDEYIRLSHTSLEDAFKISSRRLDQDQYIRLGHTSSRRFQDVFKTLAETSWRHLQDVLQKCLPGMFKTSWRRCLQNIFKMSCKHVFKTFSRRIVKLTLIRLGFLRVVFSGGSIWPLFIFQEELI